MPDPKKKKSIIVESKNDPKYKAYRDSLELYNKGEQIKKQLKNVKTYPFDKTDDLKITDKNSQAYKDYKRTGILPTKEYVGTVNGKTEYRYGYDKPSKKIDTKNTTKVLNIEKLNPLGLNITNPIIQTTEVNIPIPARIPKFYNIQENINQNFGGHQTNYKVDNIDLIPTNNLGSGNTRKITPQFAYGGNLNNNMNSNQLTEFNEGGLHHENKHGGIPIGDNNTVEQGESKIGNFVYSNRLYLDENISKEMNLPNYIKNKSFAEASKLINNKFKDRNDKPSLETKKVLLSRLADAQEILKAQKQQELDKINEAFKINSQQPIEGDIPQNMEEFIPKNQMFLGGLFGQNEMSNLTGGNQGIAGAANPYVNAGLGSLSLAGLSQGIGATPDKRTTAINGITQGAQAGMSFGPWGAGIGAAIGLGAGIMGGRRAQKEQANIAKNNAIMYNKGVSEDYAYGGNIKKYDNGGTLYPNFTKINPYESFPQSGIGPFVKFPKPDNIGLDSSFNISNLENKQNFIEPTNTLNNFKNYYKSELPQNNDYSQLGNNLLRMSPVLSNMFQLKSMKAPKTVNYAPLRNTLQYDPIDEARQEKIINQEGNKQLAAITQAGGSQGAFRNAITSIGLNSTLARNAASINTEQQNREQRLKIQDNQQRVNEYNTNYLNKAIDEHRMDLGNFDTQKSKFIGQIGSDLGEIGKEQTFKKQAEKITGYSWMGDYLNANPNYKAQFEAIAKDPTLDDKTKYAKQKALADQIYKGLSAEQKKIAEANSSYVSNFGIPSKMYGGYLNLKGKK